MFASTTAVVPQHTLETIVAIGQDIRICEYASGSAGPRCPCYRLVGKYWPSNTVRIPPQDSLCSQRDFEIAPTTQVVCGYWTRTGVHIHHRPSTKEVSERGEFPTKHPVPSVMSGEMRVKKQAPFQSLPIGRQSNWRPAPGGRRRTNESDDDLAA